MKISAKVVMLFFVTFLLGITVGYFLNNPIKEALRSTDGIKIAERSRQERDLNEIRMREYMTQALELKEDQAEAFFNATRGSRRAMRDIVNESREESNRRIRAQVDSLNAQLSIILTEEQLEKWNAMQQRYRHQRGPDGDHGNAENSGRNTSGNK